jgi:hypothetical protein
VIDRDTFAGWMRAFSERLGRPLSAQTQAAYYAELSARLTTDEFTAGARVLFGRDLYGQYPGPQAFVDAALAGREAAARLAATQRLIAAGQAVPPLDPEREAERLELLVAELGPPPDPAAKLAVASTRHEPTPPFIVDAAVVAAREARRAAYLAALRAQGVEPRP